MEGRWKVGDLVKFKVLILHKGWGSEWQWKMCIGHITGSDYDRDDGSYYEVTDSFGEIHLVSTSDVKLLDGDNA